jgi:hypothetical protein
MRSFIAPTPAGRPHPARTGSDFASGGKQMSVIALADRLGEIARKPRTSLLWSDRQPKTT